MMFDLESEYYLITEIPWYSFCNYIDTDTANYIYNDLNYRYQMPLGDDWEWYLTESEVYDLDSMDAFVATESCTILEKWSRPKWWGRDFWCIRGSLVPSLKYNEQLYFLNIINCGWLLKLWFLFKEFFLIWFVNMLYHIFALYTVLPFGLFLIFFLLFLYSSVDFWSIVFSEVPLVSVEFILCYLFYFGLTFCLFSLLFGFLNFSYVTANAFNRLIFRLYKWIIVIYDNFYWWHNRYFYIERYRSYYTNTLITEYHKVIKYTFNHFIKHIYGSVMLVLQTVRVYTFSFFSHPWVMPYFFWFCFYIYYFFRLFRYYVVDPVYSFSWRFFLFLRNALGQIKQFDMVYHVSRFFWDWNRYSAKRIWQQAIEYKPFKVFFLSFVAWFRPVDRDYKNYFKVPLDNLTKMSYFYKIFYLPTYCILTCFSIFLFFIYLFLKFVGTLFLRTYSVFLKISCFFIKGFTVLDVFKIRFFFLYIIKFFINVLYFVIRRFISFISIWKFLNVLYYIFLGISVFVLSFYSLLIKNLIFFICRIIYKLRFFFLLILIFALLTPFKSVYMLSCILAFLWDNFTDFIEWCRTLPYLDPADDIRNALKDVAFTRFNQKTALAMHNQGLKNFWAGFFDCMWYEKPFFFTYGYRHYFAAKKLWLYLQIPIIYLFALKIKFWILLWISEFVFLEFPMRWISLLYLKIEPYTSVFWSFFYTNTIKPSVIYIAVSSLELFLLSINYINNSWYYLINNTTFFSYLYNIYNTNGYILQFRFYFFYSFFDFFSIINWKFAIFMYWNFKSIITFLSIFCQYPGLFINLTYWCEYFVDYFVPRRLLFWIMFCYIKLQYLVDYFFINFKFSIYKWEFFKLRLFKRFMLEHLFANEHLREGYSTTLLSSFKRSNKFFISFYTWKKFVTMYNMGFRFSSSRFIGLLLPFYFLILLIICCFFTNFRRLLFFSPKTFYNSEFYWEKFKQESFSNIKNNFVIQIPDNIKVLLEDLTRTVYNKETYTLIKPIYEIPDWKFWIYPLTLAQVFGKNDIKDVFFHQLNHRSLSFLKKASLKVEFFEFARKYSYKNLWRSLLHRFTLNELLVQGKKNFIKGKKITIPRFKKNIFFMGFFGRFFKTDLFKKFRKHNFDFLNFWGVHNNNWKSVHEGLFNDQYTLRMFIGYFYRKYPSFRNMWDYRGELDGVNTTFDYDLRRDKPIIDSLFDHFFKLDKRLFNLNLPYWVFHKEINNSRIYFIHQDVIGDTEDEKYNRSHYVQEEEDFIFYSAMWWCWLLPWFFFFVLINKNNWITYYQVFLELRAFLLPWVLNFDFLYWLAESASFPQYHLPEMDPEDFPINSPYSFITTYYDYRFYENKSIYYIKYVKNVIISKIKYSGGSTTPFFHNLWNDYVIASELIYCSTYLYQIVYYIIKIFICFFFVFNLSYFLFVKKHYLIGKLPIFHLRNVKYKKFYSTILYFKKKQSVRFKTFISRWR